jgi:elongation factor Ts
MAEITMEKIKELRQRTGVGIHSVKEALTSSGGDIDKAIVYLREKGIAKAAKRAGNATNNGTIGYYMHGNTIGVMVELLSETDFASKSDTFKELAREIAMHIAAKSPEYINTTDVPAEIIETEKQVYKKDLAGKPENIQEKILEGKLQAFYTENVLLEQTYVRDEDKKVKDLLNEKIAALGEKVVIKGFVRFQLGLEPISAKTSSDLE